eukprot:2560333-Heterocapsa_arctica.AAC.1
MVKLIHRSWNRSVMSNVKSKRLDEVHIPVMPIDSNQIQMVHRPKVTNHVDIWNCMVVRTVNRKEILETPLAQQAMDHEYNKLENKGVWDLLIVREKSSVMSESRLNQ